MVDPTVAVHETNKCDVFVSYCHEDKEYAAAISNKIQEFGFSVWQDTRIRAGRIFDREIEEALHSARAIVVIWSNNSKGSQWVREEAAYAQKAGKIVPIRVDSVDPPLGFTLVQTIDLSEWDRRSIIPAVQSLFLAISDLVRQSTGQKDITDSYTKRLTSQSVSISDPIAPENAAGPGIVRTALSTSILFIAAFVNFIVQNAILGVMLKMHGPISMMAIGDYVTLKLLLITAASGIFFCASLVGYSILRTEKLTAAMFVFSSAILTMNISFAFKPGGLTGEVRDYLVLEFAYCAIAALMPLVALKTRRPKG